MQGPGDIQQQATLTANNTIYNRKRESISDSPGKEKLRKVVLDKPGQLEPSVKVATTSEVEETSCEWSQFYK